MKKIIIISDTHNNKKAINLVNDAIYAFSPDLIFHLGDNFEDIDYLDFKKNKIKQVPGIYHPFYKQKKAVNRLLFKIEKLKIFLTHSKESTKNDLPDDLTPEKIIKENQCDIFCFGHTHYFELKFENNILFINPGHCKIYDERSQNPGSFCLLEINKNICNAKIMNLKNYSILSEYRYEFKK